MQFCHSEECAGSVHQVNIPLGAPGLSSLGFRARSEGGALGSFRGTEKSPGEALSGSFTEVLLNTTRLRSLKQCGKRHSTEREEHVQRPRGTA